MKRQSRKSKKLLWILLSAAAAVVVLAAVAVGIFLGSSKPTEAYQSELYWNVERARYVSQGYYGVSSRIPDSDGYYHVNMAVNGEQREVLVEDVNLINRMDFEEVMGLTFDENGVVNGILYLDEFTGGIAADKYAVVSVDGNTVVCNTSTKYKGLELTYQLSDETGIWQIGDFEPMVGLPTVISEGDQVLMIRDLEGNISDVYVFPYVPPGDVYWNITRMWDSDDQCTTRERDSLGYFVYEFAVNGEIKTLRTKDQDVANLIDKHASQNMGFVFDENGDIIEVLNAGNTVCGGGLLADRYNVTELKDGEVTLYKNGTTLTATISKDCKFFDVSGTGEYVGVPVDGLEYGDKVICLKDRRDQLCVVFITNRLTTDDIYWVVERNEVWNRTTWTTDRKPAADGWYYIKLAANGKQITVKSKDAELVNKLDSYVCWCVKLDGDEIVSIQDATNRYGGSLFGAFNKVVSIEGDQLTIQKTSSTGTAIMAEDCVVYNVSTSSIMVGEPTGLREGDTIYGFTDMDGVVRYIFVTSTTYNGQIYWNVTRMYDSKNKVTTRQRAADGYYYFETVCNGKTVWLKTADKEIATKVDMVVTRARGLKVSGDVILDVLAPEKLTGYPGVKPSVSWKIVTAVSGNKVTVNDNGKDVTFKMASGCKIYNVSGVYEERQGEITTVKKGDTIVTLVNEYDQAVIVYVCGGRTKGFTTTQEACPCESGAKWMPWDGTGTLSSGYYYLTKDVVAPEGGWEIATGMKVSLRLDGHTITSSGGRMFMVRSAAVLNVCDHGTRGALIGAGETEQSGGVIWVGAARGSANLYNIDVHTTGSAENGGALAASGYMSLYNVNVYGGTAVKKGGNIAVMPTGTLRIYGGSVTGGTAAVDGSNIYIAGNAYFEDAAIEGGISAVAADKNFMINGSTIADGDYGIKLLSGQLSLIGNANIFGNKGQNLLLSDGATLSVKELGTSAKVGISMAIPGLLCSDASAAYENAIVSDDADLLIKHNASDKTLTLLCSHSHCLCGGSISEHACEDTGFTSLKQDMFTNAAAASAPVSYNGSAYILAAGNYYLAEDITLAGQVLVTGEVKLCLNGKTMAASTTRAFAVSGGTLSITDCTDSGVLQGGEANIAATVLIQGSDGNANGKLGTVNIYGGTVAGGKTNNTASGQGANIYVVGGTLNVYGGTLAGGQAVGQGGNVIVAANQTLNLYGGKLTSGTATRGNCLYVVKGANVTLDGAAAIEEIYLSGAMLNVVSLAEDFNAKLTSSTSGVFAENVTQDHSKAFTVSDDLAVIYSAEDKSLSISYAHSHCVCAGLEGHSCAEQGWIGLTQEDIISGSYTADANSYYYLKEDVQLTKAITIAGEKTFNLCLNNKTITAADGVRAFVINGGTVNITDCGEAGNIKGTKAGVGATILVQGSGGGATGKYLGTLNIYGGTVTGGESTASGGNIAVTGGTMSLYDGCLVGDTAKLNGGNVYVEKGQKLNLYGGQLISGTAGVGECLYADTEAVITLDGVQKLDAVYLNGTQLVVASVPETFTTVIGAAASGVLIQDLEETVAAQFTALPGDTLTYDPAAKTLSLTLAVRYEHGHCLCNGFEGHSCTVYEWTGLTANDMLTGNYTATADRYYYLTESVVLEAPITLSGKNTVLNLCLNEFTLTAPNANRAFVINGGTLNLTACKEAGAIIGAQHTKNGGMFYIQGTGGNKGDMGQLNLYGGMLQGGKAANGSIAYVSWGTMNVYGGIIRGGTVTNAAATVWVNNGQSMNIYGGQIHSGTGAKKANCILAMPDSVVTVGGNAQVDEIYLNKAGMKLQFSTQYPLKETARIGVQMLTPGIFAENVESYLDGTLICRNNGKVIYWDPETKTLTVTDPVSGS